jgi:hypothetical protein
MSKILIVASGPSALDVSLYEDVFNLIVVINNAWKVSSKWTYWVHPRDYKGARPEKLLPHQEEIVDYQPSLSKYGGQGACGYSVTLNASYWVLDKLIPSEIYYLGADMNYTPDKNGNTHFYGIGHDIARHGIPDPDIMVKLNSKGDNNYLENIYLRFKSIANENGCNVYNLSTIEPSRLPYPRVNLI